MRIVFKDCFTGREMTFPISEVSIIESSSSGVCIVRLIDKSMYTTHACTFISE